MRTPSAVLTTVTLLLELTSSRTIFYRTFVPQNPFIVTDIALLLFEVKCIISPPYFLPETSLLTFLIG